MRVSTLPEDLVVEGFELTRVDDFCLQAHIEQGQDIAELMSRLHDRVSASLVCAIVKIGWSKCLCRYWSRAHDSLRAIHCTVNVAAKRDSPLHTHLDPNAAALRDYHVALLLDFRQPDRIANRSRWEVSATWSLWCRA